MNWLPIFYWTNFPAHHHKLTSSLRNGYCSFPLLERNLQWSWIHYEMQKNLDYILACENDSCPVGYLTCLGSYKWPPGTFKSMNKSEFPLMNLFVQQSLGFCSLSKYSLNVSHVLGVMSVPPRRTMAWDRLSRKRSGICGMSVAPSMPLWAGACLCLVEWHCLLPCGQDKSQELQANKHILTLLFNTYTPVESISLGFVGKPEVLQNTCSKNAFVTFVIPRGKYQESRVIFKFFRVLIVLSEVSTGPVCDRILLTFLKFAIEDLIHFGIKEHFFFVLKDSEKKWFQNINLQHFVIYFRHFSHLALNEPNI